MIGRLLITLLAAAVVAGPASGIVNSGDRNDDVALRREEDITDIVTLTGDDDGGDSNSNSGGGSWSSGDNSNDGTGSGHTGVSRDRDRSRGDKTRDRTRDGNGGPKRDWSGGHTNDRSRNDSR